VSCPELSLDRPTIPAPARSAEETADSATEALAAIATTYEDARAGIISGEPSPHPLAPTGHSPTVPLTLMTSLKRTEPSQPAPTEVRQAVPGVWSRLLRRGAAARRGRHSAADSDRLPAEAFQWGPPGRVRYLS
jgi:hypothetical protein